MQSCVHRPCVILAATKIFPDFWLSLTSCVSHTADAMVAEQPYTPLWVRIWHWTVAILFLILTFTGLVLTFSGTRFVLMDYELATTVHDVTGVSLTIVYVLFLVMVFTTSYGQSYLSRWRGLLERIGRQGGRALKWVPSAPGETQIGQRRLDRMQPVLLLFQQFLYLLSVAVLLPLLIITGVLYLYPETAPEDVMGFAGLWPVALAHYVVGVFGTLFLLLHIYISTIAGFRRMIWGR